MISVGQIQIYGLFNSNRKKNFKPKVYSQIQKIIYFSNEKIMADYKNILCFYIGATLRNLNHQHQNEYVEKVRIKSVNIYNYFRVTCNMIFFSGIMSSKMVTSRFYEPHNQSTFHYDWRSLDVIGPAGSQKSLSQTRCILFNTRRTISRSSNSSHPEYKHSAQSFNKHLLMIFLNLLEGKGLSIR